MPPAAITRREDFPQKGYTPEVQECYWNWACRVSAICTTDAVWEEGIARLDHLWNALRQKVDDTVNLYLSKHMVFTYPELRHLEDTIIRLRQRFPPLDEAPFLDDPHPLSSLLSPLTRLLDQEASAQGRLVSLDLDQFNEISDAISMLLTVWSDIPRIILPEHARRATRINLRFSDALVVMLEEAKVRPPTTSPLQDIQAFLKNTYGGDPILITPYKSGDYWYYVPTYDPREEPLLRLKRDGFTTIWQIVATVHTLACLQARMRDEAYEALWPHSCQACQGWGAPSSAGDPSPPGLSLRVGSLLNANPGPACSEKGICPRCGQPGLTCKAQEPCTFCGWTKQDGGRPGWECSCPAPGRDGRLLGI
jgi:hypothetical protein